MRRYSFFRPTCMPCVLTLAAIALLHAAGRAPAQDSEPRGYRLPPPAIVELIDAPPTPGVSLSPDREWMLLTERPSLPSIAEVSQPELRLAGLRINPRTNGPSRRSYSIGLTLKRVADLSEKPIAGLPAEARIRNVRWSPDSRRFAFTLSEENGISLWAAAVESAEAKRLTEPVLNAAYGSAYSWVSDSETLICRFGFIHESGSPAERADRKPARVPQGPVTQQNIGRKAPARTYQDLLKNRDDEALFERHVRAQIARVGFDGTIDTIGTPGVIGRASPSPDGRFLLVETIHRPFSYLVPVYRFPRRVEVWDMQGELVKSIVDLPLMDGVPIGFDAVPTGPRSVGWRADKPATLVWTEAQDGGDPRVDVEIRDRIYMLHAPFQTAPQVLASLSLRAAGVTWGDDELALVSERWWKNRKRRTWIINPKKTDQEPVLLFDLSYEDRYADPGRPLRRPTPQGTSVLLTGDNGKTLFLSGSGASPEGDRPFLDKLDLTTRQTERMWQSQAPYYESLLDLLDVKQVTLLTRRESKNEPPNYFVRDLSATVTRQLTDFPHPTPQLADVQKEVIRYKRADGVPLSATLYLPAGYTPTDGPLPVLLWAYPREFKSAKAAGQMRGSPHRFVRVSSLSPLLWLTQGYAVLSNPAMPIIGEADAQPNDTFIEQLVSSAKAAIDELVRRGVADPHRIAIGGHSYGAFMAANLLAHSDLFAAGIARSGAYNRTLTPFGFQSEERTLWQAPEIYFGMSPFMHAQKVDEPLLLIHGAADNNSGTFPMQSERYYNALKGHGATARLVMLPHESHGYRARESVMHVAWETYEWLERYVKNASPREPRRRPATGDQSSQ